VEQWFMTKLVELYGAEDEDGLPINFDLLEVMETPKEQRAAFLKEKLAGCPKSACLPARLPACLPAAVLMERVLCAVVWCVGVCLVLGGE
jgi:hypothetical protein